MKIHGLFLAGTAIFISSTIHAADFGPTAPQSSGPATAQWSGPYLGGILGMSQGAADWNSPTGEGINTVLPRFPATGRSNGILAGGTAGFSFQAGPWVAGVEADIASSTSFGSAVCGGIYGKDPSYGHSPDLSTNGNWACKGQTRMLVTLGPRVGFTLGNALFYGKAGLALGRISYALDGLAYSQFRPPRMTRASSDKSSIGWMIGLGIEYALSNSWSAKIEFNHIQLAAERWQGFDADWDGDQGARTRQSHDVVKFGLNYRWGNPDAPPHQVVTANTDLSGEFGTRVGRSFGDYTMNLGDPFSPGQLNSRLSWTDQKALATEAFGRMDHSSGVFLKGMIGGLGLFSGQMFDEDFPPEQDPYSNTRSEIKSSNGLYATADLGWAYRGSGWRLGVFGGFSHNQQRMQAFGCHQIVAGNICADPLAVPSDVIILSRDESWNGVRLGVAADINLTDRLKLAVDAAYLPGLNYRGRDNHWARPDINPMVDTGEGTGYQIEAIASYRVSDRVSLGVGARRWSSKAEGSVTFPDASPSPVTAKSDRTTVFFQATYTFGAAP